MKAAVLAFSRRGLELSLEIKKILLKQQFDAETFVFEKYASKGVSTFNSTERICLELWQEYQLFVFVSACGIAVRSIAKLLTDKWHDPAVIVIDEKKLHVISLLSGHNGRANEYTRMLAESLGSEAVITTATDCNELFSVDSWAAANSLYIPDKKAAKEISALLLEGKNIGIVSAYDISGNIPEQLSDSFASLTAGILVVENTLCKPFSINCHLLPRNIILGIGCRRDISEELLYGFVEEQLNRLKIDKNRVSCIASIELKRDEAALIKLSEKLGCEFIVYSPDELKAAIGDFSDSVFVEEKTGVGNICERAAVLASREGRCLLKKTKGKGCTLAVYESIPDLKWQY